MNLFWRKQSNEIVGGYISQIEGSKQAKLNKKECELFDLLMKRVAVNDDDADLFLRSLMERGEISYIHQLFEGWRYPVLHYMLGTELAEKYVAWLHILAVIPYTQGYYRRPLRSGNAGMQYIKALDNLKDFLAIAASGLSLEVLMEGGRTEDERCFIQDINYFHLLSVEINAGNETIIQKVKDCICSDNTAGRGAPRVRLVKNDGRKRHEDTYILALYIPLAQCRVVPSADIGKDGMYRIHHRQRSVAG